MDRKSDSHHFFIVRLLLHRNSLPFVGLIQVEAFMIGDSKTHEWNLLKEQFALLVRAEAVRPDRITAPAILRRSGRWQSTAMVVLRWRRTLGKTAEQVSEYSTNVRCWDRA
jgi:hypothetical protein